MKPTSFDSPPAEVWVGLTSENRAALGRHVQTVHEYQAKSVEAAAALAAIYDGKLYVEAGDFTAFVLMTFGIRKRRAYQLAQSGRVYAGLRDAGVAPLPRSEAQIRPLAKLKHMGDQRVAWDSALAKASGDPVGVTKEDVENAVAEISGRRGTGAKPLPVQVGLAAVERALSGSPAPSEKLYGSHLGLLGLLDPRDQAETYSRAREAGDLAGKTEYGVDHRLKKVPANAVKKAVRDLAAELAEDVVDRGPADPDGLAVLLERLLVGDDIADGMPVVGGSYLARYTDAERLIGLLVEALDEHGGITVETPDDTEEQKDERRAIRARRRMARCRLEPEVAAWTWPVLIPAARRSATAWFPDPDAPSPCYVPARLTQPEKTKPKVLDLRTPTARSVLLAPGVDLLREDVPSGLANVVLARADAVGHLAFLAATNRPDRIAGHVWPANVVPALAVQGPIGPDPELDPNVRFDSTGPAAIARALDAFEAASVKGALVLDSYGDVLPDDILGRVRDLVRVVVLRGTETAQRLYEQALGLRSDGVLLIAAANVRCRPWDALLAAVPEQRVRAAVSASLPRPKT